MDGEESKEREMSKEREERGGVKSKAPDVILKMTFQCSCIRSKQKKEHSPLAARAEEKRTTRRA